MVRPLSRIGLLCPVVLAAALGASRAADAPATLNDAIVEYARARVGETVGDGECTALALEALTASGAGRPRFPGGGDYAWGYPLPSLKDVIPGDLLQFREATFQGKREQPDGTTVIYKRSFPHHTAIVSGVDARGSSVMLLHQNVLIAGEAEELRQVVREEPLRLADFKKGTVRAYRPQRRSGQAGPVQVASVREGALEPKVWDRVAKRLNLDRGRKAETLVIHPSGGRVRFEIRVTGATDSDETAAPVSWEPEADRDVLIALRPPRAGTTETQLILLALSPDSEPAGERMIAVWSGWKGWSLTRTRHALPTTVAEGESVPLLEWRAIETKPPRGAQPRAARVAVSAHYPPQE